MQAVLRETVSALITAYQRYLSPHKGFCCAHASCYGRSSCSEWIKRVVLEQPARLWMPLTLRRLTACSAAFTRLRQEAADKPWRRHKEMGFCCVVPVRCDLGLVRFLERMSR